MTDASSPDSNAVSIRILLVEDNDVSRQLMSDFLISCGHHVLCLSDAKSFVTAMAHFKPNLILLDIKLPLVDGYTLLEQLQQTPEWADIPVIVVSAYAFRADRQRALDLGARRYLVKPVKLADLTQAIDEVIDYSSIH
jgi:CheY-like chemotaxis protein